MKRFSVSLITAALSLAGTSSPALAGTTVVSSGSGVAIVSNSGTSIVVGDVVVGKGPARTEERKTGSYSGLVFEAPVDMVYTVGATPSMKITAPGNIIPLVTTEVKGRNLVIGLKKSVTMDSSIRIEAVGPSIESVELSGSGSLKLSGETGKKLAVSVSGSGSITVSGQVDKAALDISGSGEVDAGKLRTQDLEVEVAGSGTVVAHAARSAKVEVSGAGDVTISGNPKQRSVERSGAGEVTFR
jgi:hypothetical protein